MFIPEPNIFHHGSEFFRSRICVEELKYFNSKKKLFLSSRKYDPGCSSRIHHDFSPIADPESMGQKGIGSRVRIGNTAYKCGEGESNPLSCLKTELVNDLVCLLKRVQCWSCRSASPRRLTSWSTRPPWASSSFCTSSFSSSTNILGTGTHRNFLVLVAVQFFGSECTL